MVQKAARLASVVAVLEIWEGTAGGQKGVVVAGQRGPASPLVVLLVPLPCHLLLLDAACRLSGCSARWR